MRYSCIIIDDEPLSHKVLKNHINKIPELQVVKTFFNAVDAKTWLTKESVDIILLDIQMPELTGLDFFAFAQSETRHYSYNGLQGLCSRRL